MIPNELRGQKAMPFLEYIKTVPIEKFYDLEYKEINKELIDFYSQPFSVGMLVNTCNAYIPSSGYEGHRYDDNYELHRQAQEQVIFEGWKVNKKNNEIIEVNYDKRYWIKKFGDYYYFTDDSIPNESNTFKIVTLNDFITLRTLAGVTLTFKK